MSPLWFFRPRSDGHPALRRALAGAPVIRVDDYPTGVRPVAGDLSLVHRVLDALEDRGLEYHLGIVPTLLSEALAVRLRTLSRMIPVVHGYDHGQSRYTARLLAAGDPLNQHKTVGEFEEFGGLDAATVQARLADARRLLEDRLGLQVTGYIPPCNRAGRITGRALSETGYTHYFSELRIPGCPLPGLASDFYGRSDRFRPGGRLPQVVTLHATWEADLLRNGDVQSLANLLDRLATARLKTLTVATDHTER